MEALYIFEECVCLCVWKVREYLTQILRHLVIRSYSFLDQSFRNIIKSNTFFGQTKLANLTMTPLLISSTSICRWPKGKSPGQERKNFWVQRRIFFGGGGWLHFFWVSVCQMASFLPSTMPYRWLPAPQSIPVENQMPHTFDRKYCLTGNE